MKERSTRIAAASTISPLEAGFGLVHADTIVATTNDHLRLSPPGTLTVNGKATRGPITDLGLAPGAYDASLDGKSVKLILVEPARVVRQFGVRYGSLEYDLPVVTGKGNTTAPWSSLWKTGEYPDIVVDFDAPYKFVFWRGMSYAPSWALDNVMTSLFFAETLDRGVFRDCCEMMSDRECRYSHARVVHASPARVVVHWRCALADTAYTICRNQWADELFYIYPDGVAVRNVTIHLDPKDEAVWQTCPRTGRRVPCSMINGPRGKHTFNDMEFITVNPAGASSDDVAPPEAMTLLDADGFSETFHWPNPRSLAGDQLPKLKEYIFRMNYKYRPGVFVASCPDGLQASLVDNVGMRFEAGALVQEDRWVRVENLPSRFVDYIHWPVTRGYGTTPLTDPATYQERPTHTFLGFANNAPVDVTDRGDVTWLWFCGMAPGDESALRARVRAWSRPAAVDGAVYLPRQGAYRVEEIATLRTREPLVRPTFLLDRVQSPAVEVRVNGKTLDPAKVAVGVEQSLYGVQTVVTIKDTLAPAITLEFRTEDP